MTQRLLGVALLKQPLHLARQGHVAAVHGGLDAAGDRAAQLEEANDIGRNVRVGPFQLQPHRDVVGDGSHAANPLRRPLRRELSSVAVDEPGERDGSALGGDANRTGIHFGVPLQLAHHSVPDADIGIGQSRSRHGFLPKG
jgi:hypothetical protein